MRHLPLEAKEEAALMKDDAELIPDEAAEIPEAKLFGEETEALAGAEIEAAEVGVALAASAVAEAPETAKSIDVLPAGSAVALTEEDSSVDNNHSSLNVYMLYITFHILFCANATSRVMMVKRTRTNAKVWDFIFFILIKVKEKRKRKK